MSSDVRQIYGIGAPDRVRKCSGFHFIVTRLSVRDFLEGRTGETPQTDGCLGDVLPGRIRGEGFAVADSQKCPPCRGEIAKWHTEDGGPVRAAHMGASSLTAKASASELNVRTRGQSLASLARRPTKPN